jgi:hypothetical protein
MRLGKKPKRIDPRTLRLARYLIPGALPPPKPAVDWMKAVPQFGMYGNDRLADCAIAAIGNLVRMWTANVGKPAIPTDDEVIAVYNALSPNDDGLCMLDVLNYWRQNPICGVTLGAFAELDSHNIQDVELALDIFGGLYVGAELPLSAQNQDVWDVSSGSDAEFGSWGGHCVPFGRYGSEPRTPDTGLSCVTWGAPKDTTWRWFTAYVDECYCLISTDWLDGSGKTPEGLDLPTLQADLKLVTA